MMKFFKPEDFNTYMWAFCNGEEIINKACRALAELANAKLEREGKVVYGCKNIEEKWLFCEQSGPMGEDTHKALLVCIEPIEVCKHQAEKVIVKDIGVFGIIEFRCQCGAKLKPKVFEEIPG